MVESNSFIIFDDEHFFHSSKSSIHLTDANGKFSNIISPCITAICEYKEMAHKHIDKSVCHPVCATSPSFIYSTSMTNTCTHIQNIYMYIMKIYTAIGKREHIYIPLVYINTYIIIMSVVCKW